jgi:SanA protein
MFKRLFKFLILLLFLVAIAFTVCAAMIDSAGKGRVYDRVDLVPVREDGLVLGTSEKRQDGGPNPYFDYRIAAAAKLYHMGKVHHLLVSGDNRTKDYNEPGDMRRTLMAQGVPSSAISLDYAGLRTLDSIYRAKKIFGIEHFTIISQREHDERALLIAKYYGIDAIAFAADDVPFHYAVRSHLHEWEAQVKAVLDLYVLHTKPRYLGAPEPIHPSDSV